MMNRNGMNKILLSCAAVFVVGLQGLAASTPPDAGKLPERPNVLFILSDDQGWNDYSMMNHPMIETPNIDRLAARGWMFTRGYAPMSLCAPSLAAVITGKYPHQTTLVGNDPIAYRPNGTPATLADCYDYPEFERKQRAIHQRMARQKTLPDYLSEYGYRSFQGGKWWWGHYQSGGFTDGMSDTDRVERATREGYRVLELGRETNQPVFDFIDSCQKEKDPFFIWYAPMMPHTPHDPPAELLEKYRMKTSNDGEAHYWAMCEWFDRCCGEVLDYLTDNGLDENTLVFYYCDNGWLQHPDQVNILKDNTGKRISKGSVYEMGIRTPIMIAGPGIQSGIEVDTPVSTVDISSTILKAATGKIPEGLAGVDLLGTPPPELPEVVFGSRFYGSYVDLDVPAQNLISRWAIRRDGWKLIYPDYRVIRDQKPPTPLIELYNLNADPDEQKNVAKQHPEIVQELLTAMNTWWDPVKNPTGK